MQPNPYLAYVWPLPADGDIGLRCIRLEYCRRCERDTSHEFRLIDLRPRTWEMRCPFCVDRRQQQGG